MTEAINFLGGARPHKLIGREDDLRKIREAITNSGRESRIVLIEGEGGVGKSRLVNTMLQYLGVPVEIDDQTPVRESDRWSEIVDKVIVTGLLDLAETKLQTQAYLLNSLADSSTWFVPTDRKEPDTLFFSNYANAGREWQRLSDLGIAFKAVQDLAQIAENAFWEDYRKITETRRSVIVLDTAEELLVSSQWLIDEKLLQPDDVIFHTQRWLLTQIRQGHFANTTLFIVSRTQEGQAFIKLLRETVAHTPNCEWTSIPLKAFTEKEVKQYLQALVNDLHGKLADESLVDHLHHLIEDEERVKVLWLYTGGQPIRLALYADILLTGATVPKLLQLSFLEAVKQTNWVESKGESDELRLARRNIETEFSKALFRQSESLSEEDQITQILQLLVRCPRGLTAHQIHFVLDSLPGTSAENWQPNTSRLSQIEAAMGSLRKLIVVKSRNNGSILYLQDEMYRIYDESMGRDEADRWAEEQSRTWLYEKLRDWSEHHRQVLQRKRANKVRQTVQQIRLERPSRVSAIRFPTPSAVEARELAQLEANLLDAELEFLHYELLLNPQENFNETYYDLVNRRETAYREDQINVLQTEVDRLIRNKHLMHLRPWKSRKALEDRKETPYDVLRRTVKTDEAVKWIVRFFLRKAYDRVIQLTEAIEAYIPTINNPHERAAWLHTLNRAERACYYEFARIYAGQNKLEAIESLRQLVTTNAPLVKLGQMTEDEVLEETGERGFIGHPAHTRLLFVLAISWNVIGYGYATLGRYRDAATAYTNSLQYTRLMPPLFMVGSHATTINNLARALSEIGRWHAVRLCYDGLERRIEVGDWLPVSYSYNTLGLIHNDFKEPEEALEYSAVALAIARYVKDERAVGLSLLQVGEALRTLISLGSFLVDPAEEIYREANNVLVQAYEIFKKEKEPIRLAEAALELGSFYRDRTEYARKHDEEWKRWADNAEHYLLEAVTIANAHGYDHLALDAWVSLAVVYYYSEQPADLAKMIVPEVNKLVPKNSPARLRPGQNPPKPTDHPAFIFKQLNKLHEVMGRTAFDQFMNNTLNQRQKTPDWFERRAIFQTDEMLQTHLKWAAEEYVLAVNYGELYSPGSATLTHTYDQLYSYLKRLNFWEISKFYEFKKAVEMRYRVAEIRFEQPGNISGFLWSSFGDYSGEHDEMMAKLVQARRGDANPT